jgi:hypothetical protein
MQHPDAQVDVQPLHAPASHDSPDGHAAQEAPDVPQALGAVPFSHVDPEQQPLGHEAASQTHVPFEQRCPSPHAGPAPHVQPPLPEHPSLVDASQPAHTQVPFAHVTPGAQPGPSPHGTRGWS